MRTSLPTKEQALASFAAFEQAQQQRADHRLRYLAPEGVSWSSLTPEQKDALYDVWDAEDKRLEKKITDARHALIPYIGRECTICYYSDKRAAKVTQIISPSKIAVSTVETKCLDWYASEYVIDNDHFDGLVTDRIFTKRRNGVWVEEGDNYKDGVILMLHYQHHYIDPCF